MITRRLPSMVAGGCKQDSLVPTSQHVGRGGARACMVTRKPPSMLAGGCKQDSLAAAPQNIRWFRV